MSWKTIKTETLLSDYHVSVKKDCVELPDGAVIDDFYTVTIPDAAMVAAITTDGKILLKSEYRYACESEVIECPAGMFEDVDSIAIFGISSIPIFRIGKDMVFPPFGKRYFQNVTEFSGLLVTW